VLATVPRREQPSARVRRCFTFDELHARTKGRDGPARAAVFDTLRPEQQTEAWGDLRRRIEAERGA
jgi:hypothetical protein